MESAKDLGSGSGEVRGLVRTRQVRLLYDHLPGGLAVTFVVSGLLCGLLWQVVPHRSLSIWLVLMYTVAGVRVWELKAYRRESTGAGGARRWQGRFVTGSTVQGLLWGLAGVFLFPSSSSAHQFFLIVVLSAMAGGAVMYLSPVQKAYSLYVVPLLLPASLRMVAQGTYLHVFTGIMGLVYLAGMLFVSKKTHDALTQSIRLGIEKQMLADTLTVAKERLEETNRAYQQEIEERKRIQKDLDEHRNHLEALVTERTQELSDANERLRQEIAGREEIQETLKENEQRFRDLAELLPEIVYEVDADGLVTFVNRRAYEITGYTPQDLDEGFDALTLVAPEERPRARVVFERLMQGEETGSNEYTAVRKDGSRFPVMAISSPIIRDRKAVGARGIIVDMTRFRNLETRLRHSQKMEAIGTLAGGIAHDFNNILGAIVGYTELTCACLPEGLSERRNLAKVLQAAERARGLVAQILTFSRPSEEGREPVSMAAVVKEGLDLIKASIPSTIEIRQEIAAHACNVFGDATQLHQVLVNLCTNAYQAMREEGGVLEIRLHRAEVDPYAASLHPDLCEGRYAVLSISDTGPGMDPETMSRVFEPFFTTKTVGKGSGMGLAVVHGIVKAYGGAVLVDSRLGEGTTFSVYLPLHDETTPENVAIASKPLGGTERVLLVDDEPILLEVVRQILESLGYEVTPTTAGKKALAKFREAPGRYDIIVTDQTMPGLTGAGLIREVKALRPDVPVIICTGYSDVLDEKKAKELGAAGFLLKPVSMNSLATAVREALASTSRIGTNAVREL